MSTCSVLFFIGVFINYFQLYQTGVVSDLYCKDPDSEKFYPIDTTWTSLNFCQNYTCKLRKRNIESKNPKLGNSINFANSKNDEDKMLGSNSQIVEQFVKPENGIANENQENNLDGEDRYLTEDEINTIIKLLHTIKKSELQSVIDIYNLAQDIYKDMDKANSEKIVNYQEYDKPKTSQDYNYNYATNANWLNPYNAYNRAKSVQSNYISNVVPRVLATPLPNSNTNQYYGTRNSPYYYPIPRSSSYNYNPYPQQRSNAPSSYNQMSTLCPTSQAAYQSTMTYLAPWINRILQHQSTIQNPQSVYNNNIQPITQQYPYSYMYRYNNSYPNDYYNKNYWPTLYPNYVKSNNEPETQIFTNKNEIIKDPIPNIIDDNNKDVNNENKETAKLEEWQTEPLSPEVLEDVKANWDKPIFTNTILDELLPKSNIALTNPFKRTVKLEKVGTLLRLDDDDDDDDKGDVAREKRNIDVMVETTGERATEESKPRIEHDYEAYIEIEKCEPPTEVGFFRVGNTMRPFPECCPQKIGKTLPITQEIPED